MALIPTYNEKEKTQIKKEHHCDISLTEVATVYEESDGGLILNFFKKCMLKYFIYFQVKRAYS